MTKPRKQQTLTQSEKEELDLVAMLLKKRMSNRASSDKTKSTSEEQVIMDEAGPSLEPWMSRP
jgi:hypothetical protein